MSDAITLADQVYDAAMHKGSQFLLNAIRLERGDFTMRPVAKSFPRHDLVWRNHYATHNQWQTDATMSSQNSKRQCRVLAAIAEKNRMAETRRVSRDPCPMCGVRADVGCRHSRSYFCDNRKNALALCLRISHDLPMQTHADIVIDHLGGTSAVAKLIETPVSTVHSWRSIGIPASRMAHLRLAAKAVGASLPDYLENMG